MGLNGVNLKVFLVVLMAVYATAVVVTIIDDFTPNTLPLSVSNVATTDTTTKIRSSNGNATLGTERDQTLTILPGTSNKVISSSVVAGSWSNAFLQDTTGWSIMQYDGFDNSSAVTLNPGISNIPGTGLDLTFSTSAYAFYFLVTADLAAYYQINIYGANSGEVSTYAFIYDPLEYVDPIDEIVIPFADFTGTATFTNVHAIELILNVTDGTVKNPVDTAILLFGIFGYQVTGTVFYDCNSNSNFDGSEVGISGVTVTLFNSANAVVRTTTTAADGTFAFLGLVNDTYRACVTNPGNGATATIPTGTGGCYNNLVLQNANDATGLLYGFTISSAITAPGNVNLTCGDCTTTTCLGDATAVGCGGNPTVSHTDVTTGTCPQVITRTFTAPGATSVQQIIRVSDNSPPTIDTPATAANVVCSNKTPSISTWNSTHAGAIASDTCSSVIWSSNYTGAAAPNCGTIFVQFTASDACANQVSFVSTYTVTDTVPPTFSRLPTASSAPCDISGNTDQAAYNAWLSNRAGATAIDDCAASSALIWSNTSPGVIGQGCNVIQPVTFNVNDGCGNIQSASSTFTVFDTRSPFITVAAAPQSVSCSGDVNSTFSIWLSTRGGAQATDNCATSGTLIWTNNFSSSTPSGCNSATTVIFTVTDRCGNSNTTSAGFTVTSSTGPVLSRPASPLSVDCGAANSSAIIQAWLNTNGGAIASDNCTAVDWTNNFSGAGTCQGAPVTFTACNRCTPAICVNTTTTATINDNSAPVFVKPPASPIVSCDAFAVQQFNTWLSTAGAATVTDNCSPPQSIILSNNWPVGQTLTSGCNNAATVSFFATDACGNVSPAQIATFKVVDNNPPSITPASDIEFDCDDSNINSFNSWLNINGGATASDICSNVTWTNNATKPFQKGCDSTQIVTFTASDSCGLSQSTTAAFHVFDNDPPRLITPASDLNTTCSSTVQAQVTAWLNNNGGAVAVDDCTPVSWTHNYDGLTGGCTLSAHVTFLVHDQCGFTTPTTATFAVVDNIAPVISTPAKSVTVNCDSNTESALETFLNGHAGAVATDACQPSEALTWTNNFGSAPTQCGSIVVTFSVTDGCGRSAQTTATFAVSDRSAPVIDPQAQSVSVECDGYGNTEQYNQWVKNNGGAAANDQCAINVKWTNTALPTGPFGCGSTAASFIVTDGCNNTAATSASFTVVDTVSPVIFPEAQDAIVQCDGAGNSQDLFLWLNSHGGAAATDVCTGIVVNWSYEIVGFSSDDFSCTNFTTYTFTAFDLCGNSATTTATFGITDDGPPAIEVLPSDLTIECGVSNTAQINAWLANAGGFVADDLCSEVVYANNFEQQSNPGFGCFVLPVTFFASDACGHTVQADANLVLQDSKAPTFVNFPANITLPCDADTSPETTGLPAVSDACFSNLNSQVTYNDTTNDLPPNPNTPLCPGDHIIYRTFYVTDPCGNSAQQTQIITVEIARASGPCDASGCLCDNECCPEPTASDCLPTDCLPQNCAASYCEVVPCSCGFNKRDLSKFAIEFPNSPIPQCEPIYIFVHDDSDDDAEDNSVSVVNKPLNFVMSERPFSPEEIEKMKNEKKALNHQKTIQQQKQEVQVNTEEVKQAEGSVFHAIFNLF